MYIKGARGTLSHTTGMCNTSRTKITFLLRLQVGPPIVIFSLMVLLLSDWQLTLFVGCRSYDLLVSIAMRSTLAEQHHLQTRRFACAGSTFFNMMEHTCEIRAQDL